MALPLQLWAILKLASLSVNTYPSNGVCTRKHTVDLPENKWMNPRLNETTASVNQTSKGNKKSKHCHPKNQHKADHKNRFCATLNP